MALNVRRGRIGVHTALVPERAAVDRSKGHATAMLGKACAAMINGLNATGVMNNNVHI